MKTLLIAEAGVNHNGCLKRALEMIEVAAECGVDYVKFQAWKAELLTSKLARQAEYQTINTGSDGSQLDLLKSLELKDEDYQLLIDKCRQCGIEFLCTPMDMPSVSLLSNLKVNSLKIPSGELTNAPYLIAVGRTKLPLIISTGMAGLEEIEACLGAIIWGRKELSSPVSFDACRDLWNKSKNDNQLKRDLIILHCTTEYPAPFEDVNLLAIKKLASHFDLPVGYSDHTKGINVTIAAAALGAVVIEKHFTLDRNLPGPDHRASIEPVELRQLVQAVREVNKSLGTADKRAAGSEIKNMPIARKSLIAAKEIKKGQIYTQDNIIVKRPGSGVSPWRYWEYLGLKANRDYQPDELIDCNDKQ